MVGSNPAECNFSMDKIFKTPRKNLRFNTPKGIILTFATVPVLWNEARVGGQCGGEIWNYELFYIK